MPRFVILRHDSPKGLHWDLLLETGPVLRTWTLRQPPDPGLTIACDALPDHRPMYLDYEGPLSDNRGSVTRWDRGAYEIHQQSDTQLVIDFCGEKLTGRATLERSPDDPRRWWFSC